MDTLYQSKRFICDKEILSDIKYPKNLSKLIAHITHPMTKKAIIDRIMPIVEKHNPNIDTWDKLIEDVDMFALIYKNEDMNRDIGLPYGDLEIYLGLKSVPDFPELPFIFSSKNCEDLISVNQGGDFLGQNIRKCSD